jgi:Rhs element Vgr protein
MSTVTVTIANKEGTVMNALYEVLSIDVVKEVERIPYAQITLLDGSAAKQKFVISDGAFFEPGKEIEIKLRYEGKPATEASVFKGLVVRQVVEATEQGLLLTVELKDAAIKLAQSRRSEVYYKKSDDEIIGDLLTKAGVGAGTLAPTQPVHPEIVQYYSSDWDFIISRAEACGLWVMAEDGKLSMKKVALAGEPTANHTFEFGISDIYNFEIEVDASHQRAEVQSIAWDVKEQKLTQASKATPFSLAQGNLKADELAKAVGGTLEALSSPVPLDTKALKAWADGVMVRSRMAMIRGRISIPGFGKIKCMELMKVAGVGKRFNGKTLVTGVRHRVDLNGWQTDIQFGLSPERFSARRDIVDVPAAGLLPGVNGLQIGIVGEFEKDPDDELRVKVILPGIDEAKGIVWARLAAPDAGKERGYFFRPEKGDEVVVGFFNDDPRQAVILGGMYSSKNTPPKDFAEPSEKNIEKGIVSKKGTTLGFIDDEKPAVFIETPGKNKIIFDDDGELVQISDQHGNSITMNKDGIEIKSAKDLKIEASGNVEIKGAKVDVK